MRQAMAHRDPSSPTPMPTILRYGIAVLSVAIAIGLGFFVLRHFEAILTPFLFAVATTVWYAGTGPGVLAIVLSVLSLNYFFLRPDFSFSPISFADLVYLTFCIFCALAVGWVSAVRRRAEQELRQAREELEAKVVERTANLQRSEERLRVQHTVAQILAEAATIEEATPRILLAMGDCLGWDVGVLWRVDREAEALRCVELWHKASIAVPEFERVSREFTFGPGLGLPGRVWSSLEPEYIPDVAPDENFPRAPIAEQEGLRAAFAFPILLGREVLGVIEFFSREIRQPDQELLNVLATIGSQIGQFIERKRAEEALRRSEAYLAEAQRLSHCGVTAYKGSTVFYGSEEIYRIWGFDPAQGVPSRKAVLQRIHPDDRDRLNAEVERALGEKRRYSAAYRIVLPDGTVKHLESIGQPVFSTNGELVEVVATQIDVTERKRAEEGLRESEAKLRDYAETASDWFWEIDPDYKFTLLTENAFGSDAADRIGTACWDHALDLETEPEKWRFIQATLDSRQPFRDFVYCSAGRNGSPMYVKASGKPVFDANGEFRGY